jgi:hypothetical protein
MVNIKFIVKTIAAISPTLLLLIWTLTAALVPGADVFIIALLQLIIFVIYVWRLP